jgi:hypothetical protein
MASSSSMKAVVGRALREVGTELKKHGGVEVRFALKGVFVDLYQTSTYTWGRIRVQTIKVIMLMKPYDFPRYK